MFGSLSTLLGVFLKVGAVALVFNEVRGLILAVPILYGMYEAGGTWMAIWLGMSSLGGVALSVIVPIIAARKIRSRLQRKTEPQPA